MVLHVINEREANMTANAKKVLRDCERAHAMLEDEEQ